MADKNEKIALDPTLFCSVRVIALIEVRPQSNEYLQIVLSEDQYKQLSQFMFENFTSKEKHPPCGNPNCKGKALTVEEQIIKLPDLREWNNNPKINA